MRNLSQCHCVRHKPAPVPLCPAQTCPSATLAGTNLSQCHRVRHKPVPVPPCPAQTSQCQCVRQKPVPVPHCPAHISHDPGSKPDLPCDRQSVSGLAHGTALLRPVDSVCPLLTPHCSGNGPHGEKSTQHSHRYTVAKMQSMLCMWWVVAGNRSKCRRYAVVFITVFSSRRAYGLCWRPTL